jgi:hypothetical protein
MRKLGLGLAVAALLNFSGIGGSRAQTAVTVQAAPQAGQVKPEETGKTSSDLTTSSQSASVELLIQELTTLSNTLDDWDDEDHSPSKEELVKLRSSLPKNWTVQTDDGSFVISSAPLEKALEAGKIGDAGAWLDHALGEVRSYARQGTSRDRNARRELDKILGTAEFSGVRPPNAWELFRQRVSAWIARMLAKLSGGIARYPIAGEFLLWGILLLAVSLLARWLFYFLVSRERMEGLTHQDTVLANRTWQEWIRLAKEAAARQDFREAVHSSYWAGIARLEDLGVFPRDRTKTPREYLRIVPRVSQHELAARPVTYSEPLKELTIQLERIWYANRGARASDFEDTLKQLKALGCQLE